MAKSPQAGPGRSAKAEPGKSQKVAKKAKPAPRRSKKDLRLDVFVAEYVRDLNGRRAAVAAGYSPDTARVKASQLLADPKVSARVNAARAELVASAKFTTEDVFNRWQGVASADPRDLSELHRGACRYCWGIGHLFQRTPREMREARADWARDQLARQTKGEEPTEFNEGGGEGYNPKKDPHPDCPECFGDGEERVVFKDTRDLNASARLLFAGVEQTANGLKVRTHSPERALANIARTFDMFGKKNAAPQGGDLAEEMRKARERAGIR